MATRKRSKLQREDDLGKLLALLRRGVSQGAAGKLLGVTQQQISYDWLELLDRLKLEKNPDTEAHRLALQAEYAEMKEKLWNGWDRSQQPAEVLIVKVKESPGKAGKGKDEKAPLAEKRTESMKRSEGQAGDPHFIDSLSRIAEGERKMWGLDAPVKIAPTTPDGQESYPPLEALVAALQKGEAHAADPSGD